MTDLLYFSFGSITSLQQALFSVYSFLLYHDSSHFKIHILTDDPSYFSTYLKSWSIHYHLLDAEKVKEMRGEIDFVHRMKIASIEQVFLTGAEKILYVDSDTLFLRAVDEKMALVGPTNSLMHKHEFHFPDMYKEEEPGLTRKLYELIKKGGIAIGTEHFPTHMDLHFSSWNAGVIGLSASKFSLLQEVYAFTDRIYPLTFHHASEQFSFSYVLEKKGRIITCEEEIFHYWPKPQKEAATRLMKGIFDEAFKAMDGAAQTEKMRVEVTNLHQLLTKDPQVCAEMAISAFYLKKYWAAYWGCLKAFWHGKRDLAFLKDIGFHTKQILFNRGR